LILGLEEERHRPHLLPYLADAPPVSEAATEQRDTLREFLATAQSWLEDADENLTNAREERSRLRWLVETIRTRLRETAVSDVV
jgi:hypothetical protein